MKKDTWKLCEFHKSPSHNTSESCGKQSFVVELKDSESKACYEFESNPDKGKQIIDAKTNAIVATIKVQKIELKDLQGGEHLFHSQMWMNGSSLQ